MESRADILTWELHPSISGEPCDKALAELLQGFGYSGYKVGTFEQGNPFPSGSWVLEGAHRHATGLHAVGSLQQSHGGFIYT